MQGRERLAGYRAYRITRGSMAARVVVFGVGVAGTWLLIRGTAVGLGRVVGVGAGRAVAVAWGRGGAVITTRICRGDTVIVLSPGASTMDGVR